MQWPPLATMEWMDTPRPKPWNMGIMASILWPGRKKGLVAMIWAARALKLRLDSRMPLVTPVVPPEYRMAAGSSALRRT